MDPIPLDSILAPQTACLPLELVLTVLELAVWNWRDIHPRWSASLRLVCHAAQIVLEPIIYSLLAVEEVRLYDKGTQKWTMKREAQLLEHIIANDTPRVRHLILGQTALDLVLNTAATTMRSVPRLSIIQYDRRAATDLLRAPLVVHSDDKELLYLGLVGDKILLAENARPWTRGRFWASDKTWRALRPHYDFLVTDAPGTGYNRSAVTHEGARWFFLELGDLLTLSRLILSDIADILRLPQQNAHVVLACEPGYVTPWGIGVEETIQLLDASRPLPPDDLALEEGWRRHQRLPIPLDSRDFRVLRKSRVSPEVLYSRVHISNALWGCNGPGSVGLSYGRAIERGDAWDEGRLIRRYIPR